MGWGVATHLAPSGRVGRVRGRPLILRVEIERHLKDEPGKKEITNINGRISPEAKGEKTRVMHITQRHGYCAMNQTPHPLRRGRSLLLPLSLPLSVALSVTLSVPVRGQQPPPFVNVQEPLLGADEVHLKEFRGRFPLISGPFPRCGRWNLAKDATSKREDTRRSAKRKRRRRFAEPRFIGRKVEKGRTEEDENISRRAPPPGRRRPRACARPGRSRRS